METVTNLASQRAFVIFSNSSCCLCHTVRRLFYDLGIDPAIYEMDGELWGKEMEKALAKMLGQSPPVPVVLIGGRMVGSTQRVMSLHLGGQLVPLLRDAGALWL